MNIYVFLLTSMFLFFIQLGTYLLLAWVAIMIVGYPIKYMIKSIKGLLRK